MKTQVAWFVALFALALVTGRLQAAEIEVGAKAPDFTAKGTDGKQYTLTGIAKDAKAVVVCFTCNKCPVAVAYEDRFIEFAKQYGKKGVKFIAINANAQTEDLEQMQLRAEEKGFNFPYAFDESGTSARKYGARVTPHIFIVDGNGKVAYRGAFDDKLTEPSEAFVVDAVDALLEGKAPSKTSTRAFGCGIRLK